MLLAVSPSNHHFIIGVRPRAVTTPVQLRSLSGTWGKMSSRLGREDPSLNLKPTSSTRPIRGATNKIHWLSTVRVPGPRANLNDPARRRCLASITAPPVSTETAVSPPPPPPARPESPLAHARRRAAVNVPPPCIVSSDTTHTLSIALPRPGGAPLAPEMVTVSVRRGGRVVVVADAWHLEHDCERVSPIHISICLSARRDLLLFVGHYEWCVALPQREVDLGAVRARFGEDGTLVIDVPRRTPRSGTRRV
ncbi:hypothetical protein EI94DRAFT_1728523 [Lactarius quietus]|nr:hypothetical protein EI94DRAFT_1728523 [Lactarius quietus]